MRQETEAPEKTEAELDLEYLKLSLEFENTQLTHFRYNIKEIKACVETATKEKNEQRLSVLHQQKTQTNNMIKNALTDVKRIGSIYRFYLKNVRTQNG